MDWLDLRISWWFSRFYQRYRQQLIYRYRDMDSKGMGFPGPFTLRVDEVFIDLSLDPTPPHQASANPTQQLPEVLRQGRHSIWEYLTARPSVGEHLVILGTPGSGKTTLVQHIALTLMEKKKRQEQHAPPLLPLVLFLREHAQAITARPALTLTELVHDSLAKHHQQAPEGWFEEYLKRGRCLVLLDGLDEVADPAARRGVAAWVEEQMHLYGQNRFVMTSRRYGYSDNPINNVTVLTVRPYTREQIVQYVHKWYLANESRSTRLLDPGVRLKAAEEADELLVRLQSKPELLELAVNPLLLTMMATVHRYQSALPGKRVDLYAKVCEMFLGRREEAKDVAQELSPTQKQSILQPLAYHLMCQKKQAIAVTEAEPVIAAPLARVQPDLSPAAFLKLIENSSGLLLEGETGAYEFAHRAFQEYLAAVHIKEQGAGPEELDQVHDGWWHETLLLYAAQTDATVLLQACLTAQPASSNALWLAIESVEEAREVQPEVRMQVQTLMEQGVEDDDPVLRRLVAEVLLTRRLRHQMNQLDERRYVATSLMTCAEFQLFLDEQLAQNRWCQPGHWRSARFPVGRGRTPVLGVRRLEAIAFCDWLTAREEGDWCYRIPGAEEITPEQHDAWVAKELLRGAGFWAMQGLVFNPNVPDAHRFPTPELVREQLTEDFIMANTCVLYSPYAQALDQARSTAETSLSTLDLTRVPNSRDTIHARDAAHLFSDPDSAALALDLAKACALAPVLSFDLARDRNLALDFARMLAGDLAFDLNLVFDRVARSVGEVAGQQGEAVGRLLRWLIRISCLLLVETIVEAQKARKEKLSGFKRQLPREITSFQEEGEMQQVMEDYRFLWMEFSILEARITGALHPYEGILIVKEREQSKG